MLILLVLSSIFLTLSSQIVSVKSTGKWNLLLRSMHKACPLVKMNLTDITQFYFISSFPIKSAWNPQSYLWHNKSWVRKVTVPWRECLPQHSTNSQHSFCGHFMSFKTLSKRALCVPFWLLEEDGQGINLQNWPGQSIKVSRASIAQEYTQKPGLTGAKLVPCQGALLSICLSYWNNG